MSLRALEWRQLCLRLLEAEQSGDPAKWDAVAREVRRREAARKGWAVEIRGAPNRHRRRTS